MPSGERLADSACADAYKASLKCLDDNAYDKAKCEAVFDAYKECKGKEYAARKRERLDARRGKKGRLFG